MCPRQKEKVKSTLMQGKSDSTNDTFTPHTHANQRIK